MNSGGTILYFWESAGGKLPCATHLFKIWHENEFFKRKRGLLPVYKHPRILRGIHPFKW